MPIAACSWPKSLMWKNKLFVIAMSIFVDVVQVFPKKTNRPCSSSPSHSTLAAAAIQSYPFQHFFLSKTTYVHKRKQWRLLGSILSLVILSIMEKKILRKWFKFKLTLADPKNVVVIDSVNSAWTKMNNSFDKYIAFSDWVKKSRPNFQYCRRHIIFDLYKIQATKSIRNYNIFYFVNQL